MSHRCVVRVDPLGQTMAVDILDTSGASVAAYDSPQFAAARRALPLTIDQPTDFCVAAGSYDVSCKVGGTEVANDGVMMRVQAGDVPVLVVPDWVRELTAQPASGLPTPASGDAGKVVTVTDAEDGFELATPTAASGPTQWVEYDISTDAADWGSPTGGTWDFGIAVTGVIQTTDPETVGTVTYSTPIPGEAFIVQAEVNIPTGQTSVSGDVTVAAGSQDDGGASDGFEVGCDDVGDGQPIHVNVRVGAHSNDAASATDIVQDEWHRVTAHVSGSTRGSVYVDGVYVTSHLDNASYSTVDKLIISVLGLAKVRNIKVWALQPTAP